MGWVRDSIHFGDTVRRLVIDKRDAFGNLFEGQLNSLMSDTPEAIARALTTLIEEYRPELKGGTLIAMRYDHGYGCWEFTYCHPSFPRVACGEEIPRERLLAPAEPDAVAGAL